MAITLTGQKQIDAIEKLKNRGIYMVLIKVKSLMGVKEWD